MQPGEVNKLQKRFGLIGESDAIKDIVRTIAQIAETDITVLITGETGTGKELIANAIHNHSLRKHEKMVKVNCGAIPSGILESELFGHKKGSFTGAVEDRKGYFETANGGSVFLDEIGEMPPEVQVKFLRVLEEGEFIPVGGSESKTTDVRIIAATNKNLQEEINKENGFRKDLYYRIKTIKIVAPPLRKRTEDIPVLAKHFALDFANRHSIAFKGFSPKAMKMMKSYSWPGNVRELKNFVESMITLNKGEVIESSQVASKLSMEQESPTTSRDLPMTIQYDKQETAERELILRQLFILRRDVNDIKNALAGTGKREAVTDLLPSGERALQRYRSSDIDISPEDIIRTREREAHEEDIETIEDDTLINKDKLGEVTIEDVERELIKETLEKFNFQKRKTARALDISERTLYRKIKKYDLEE
jgi:transcriptional regulator with PAS, ATPase and Fis domain